jgi:large subunit ribosomal protein L9
MAHHIHVILTDDLHNVGKSGELVKVRPGFARNFLIPRGLAVGATEKNVSRIEHDKKVAETRATKLKAEATDLATKLGAVKLTITKPAGEGDKLYGSVTAKDIEEALAKEGFAIDRRRIVTDAIKAVGTYQIPVRLATNVSANVELTVAAAAK